jgi:hypothetical protein
MLRRGLFILLFFFVMLCGTVNYIILWLLWVFLECRVQQIPTLESRGLYFNNNARLLNKKITDVCNKFA